MLLADRTILKATTARAIFAANVYEKAGFKCVPDATEERYDIIQAVELKSEEGLIAFCKGIQAAAPVDSFVTPEPWAMPGYDSDVIMAAGAFVQGSSIELSADGPVKEPYAVYFQGGLTWYHAKLGIMMALQKLVDAGILVVSFAREHNSLESLFFHLTGETEQKSRNTETFGNTIG